MMLDDAPIAFPRPARKALLPLLPESRLEACEVVIEVFAHREIAGRRVGVVPELPQQTVQLGIGLLLRGARLVPLLQAPAFRVAPELHDDGIMWSLRTLALDDVRSHF